MVRRRPFIETLGCLVVCASLCAGCGGDSTETGPAEEPAKGPGVAAGGGTGDPKAPEFGPAKKGEKGAAPKAAEKKK